VAEIEGGLKDKVIGTGAYIVKELNPGEGFLMERNPDYWQKNWQKNREGDRLPYIDKIRGFIIKDLQSEIAAFRVGQIDLTALPDWETVRDVLKTNPNIFAYRVPSAVWGNQTMFFHLDREPYNDVRVRQAISMAIDRQKMREVLFGGKDEGDIYGPLPWVWTYPDWPRDYSKLGPNFEYNPKRAKELLAQAGYPNGFKAKMQFTLGGANPTEEGALMVKEFLRGIGIDLELVRMEPASQNSLRIEGTWDDLLWDTIQVGGPVYDDMVYWPYHSKGPPYLNPDRLKDPALDKMLDDQRALDPQDPRHLEMTRQILKYLADKVYRVSTVVYTRYEVQHRYLHNGASAPYNWFRGYGYYAAKYAWLDPLPLR